jgi:hypothetical protein
MLSRTLTLLLALALLVSVASSAQCIVRCVNPVAPPRCHHHAPAQPNACADAMPALESRAHIAPAAIALSASPLVLTELAASQPVAAEPATASPHPDPPLTLRI